MTKTKERTSAAIVGLLDAIKSEGLKPIDQEQFNQGKLSSEKVLDLNNDRLNLNPSAEKPPKFSIVEIDPAKVTPWYMANRLQAHITEDSCAELIESIQHVGQQIPALIRKTTTKDSYELICGARRLFVCKKLGRKLLAAIVDLSDKEALLAMDAENRPRNDISPYERAIDYRNWIEKEIYKNQADICKTIAMKKSLFTQVFSLSELDETIVNLFGHPNNLSIRWGYQLSKACKNPDTKNLLLQKANEIAKLNLKPAAVYANLMLVLKTEHTNPSSGNTTFFTNPESNIQMLIQNSKNSHSIHIKNIDKTALEVVTNLLAKELNLRGEKQKV